MKRTFKSPIYVVALSAMVASGMAATFSISAVPAHSKSDSIDSSSDGRNDNGESSDRASATSSLGALNAANANALANTSRNSRDGMIALYKSAVMASAGLAKQIEEAQAILNEYVATQEAAGYVSAYKTYNEYLRANPPASADDILHWETLNSLQAAIDKTTAEAVTAKALESEVLKLAANKETGDEVIAALWNLLDF